MFILLKKSFERVKHLCITISAKTKTILLTLSILAMEFWVDCDIRIVHASFICVLTSYLVWIGCKKVIHLATNAWPIETNNAYRKRLSVDKSN